MAIAIATIMVAAGLSTVPPALALTADCNEDFDIADSESQAVKRSLDPGTTKVGHRVVSSGSPEEITVRLPTSVDELTWQVFYLDASNNCVEYSATGCDGEVVMDTKGQEQSCTLDDPSLGDRDYYVVHKNTESPPADELDFKIWESS